MQPLSRRRFLQATGLAVTATTLAACGGSDGPGDEPGKPAGPITWWDQFQPLADLEKDLFATYEKETGVKVDYTVYNPEKQGQALQLAKQSGELPDVFTLAGLGIPPAQLQAAGWFAPLELSDEAKGKLPEGALLTGLTDFDGKTYSFPQFSFRQHTTLTWFSSDVLEQAGLDSATPPTSYDDFRAACRSIQKKGGGKTAGVLLPLQFTDRMGAHLQDLAQAAGHTGEAFDWKTGAFAYHSDAFVQALDFLLSLKKDKVLFSASSSMDARKGRARWAAGSAGFFFDGPWNIGVVVDDFAKIADKTGVGTVPVPEAGTSPQLYAGPQGGTFWVKADSESVSAASELLGRILDPEYQIGLAENMDQPPIDLEAVKKADVHDAYKQATELFAEQVFLAPSPVVKNPEVAKVQAEMKTIDPDLGTIVQGAFSGDVTDVRGALKKLSDQSEAERERALKKVQAKAEVSVDDWTFANWAPGADYGSDKY